jgi:hypothetical protein
MASPIYSHYYSTDAHLPVRWMSPEILIVSFSIFVFCETRTKRSVEVYRGRNLDPSPAPLPTDRDRHLTDPSKTVTDSVGTHHLP